MKPTRKPAPACNTLAEPQGSGHPILSLQREMNGLFDRFFGIADPFSALAGFDDIFSGPARTALPRVNVAENDREVVVTAELPGMDEKDIDVTIVRDALTLRGERRSETETREGTFHRMERSTGAFHRTIPLPAEVVSAKAEASFRKGVLTVRLPKDAASPTAARKIDVKPG